MSKYCYHCGHMTAGEPLFCNFCGRSYDVKLCPGHHVNPRFAEVCSQCGSRDLSTPQPKVSVWWRVLRLALNVALGTLAVALTIHVLTQALQNEVIQHGIVLLAFLVCAVWAIWKMLPDWFRQFVRWAIKRRGHRDKR